jgi:hypothetical protein
MQSVKLYTATGAFVVSGWVPPFLDGLEAEVLIWGERIFQLRRRHPRQAILDTDGALQYDEVFAIALVNTERKP